MIQSRSQKNKKPAKQQAFFVISHVRKNLTCLIS